MWDLQKDFVDPAMRSPMLVDGGQAVVPTVAEAVAVARERGIYVVWVHFLLPSPLSLSSRGVARLLLISEAPFRPRVIICLVSVAWFG